MSEPHAVILFHTTNHALRAERLLQKAEIGCKLIPVPRHLSSDCGVCVRIARHDRQSAERVLLDARVEMAGTHEI